jgi:Rieske Fe-S protein
MMSINRREFVILTCAAAAGCAGSSVDNPPVTLKPVTMDAGPAGDYAADGVYDRFRDRGFFIVRKGPSLIALSAICTHRRCKLSAEPDRSFYCKCHGSTFDPSGKVTEGPATRDLPPLPTSVDERGHLIVHAVAG